jgi:deazaflavin-dependent oxidoreductase (nitroreductase family)
MSDRPDASPRPTIPQRWIQRLAMIGWVTRLAAPIVQAIDDPLLRWSGERRSLTRWLTGMPVARLTTTGAHSGRARTHPLTVLRHGEALAVVGSNFGRRRPPAWVHNLRAGGVARLHTSDGPRACSVRPATSAEYDVLWRRAVDLYPGYAVYARRAAPRAVPIFVLTPYDDATASSNG